VSFWGAARDAELLGHMRDRSTLLEHTLHEHTTTMNSQTRVSVATRTSWSVKTSAISTKSGGPPHSQAPTRHQRPRRLQLDAGGFSGRCWPATLTSPQSRCQSGSRASSRGPSWTFTGSPAVRRVPSPNCWPRSRSHDPAEPQAAAVARAADHRADAVSSLNTMSPDRARRRHGWHHTADGTRCLRQRGAQRS
jgi:hypothetical protein